MPSQPQLRIILTREELVLLLRLIEAETMPGLGPDPLRELAPEQAALGLIYAERSLRARELATIENGGNLVVHPALLTSVAVCAYAQNSILAYHVPSDSRAVRYSAHKREEAIVTHTIAEGVLHILTVLPDQDTLLETMLSVCQCENLPTMTAKPISIKGETLSQVRQLAERGDVESAIDLQINCGVDQESGSLLAAVLANPHHTSVFVNARLRPDNTVQEHEVTILQNTETAWLMTNASTPSEDEAETDPYYLLQSTSASGLKTILGTWFEG